METNKQTFSKNESGQALLFIIVAMSIALSVGISVSSRTLTSLKRTSSTDTSSRVFAAAEGGLEWFLSQPISVLKDIAEGRNSCPNGSIKDDTKANTCILQYEPQAQDGTNLTDKIQANAAVTIDKFQFNNEGGTNHYWFNIEPGEVKEIPTIDYDTNAYYNGNLDICWKSKETTQSSFLYFFTYNDTALSNKTLVEPQNRIGAVIDVQGTTATNSTQTGYSDCRRINIGGNMIGLRIKVLYAKSIVAVFPVSGTFPTQGFKIVSKGQLDNVAEKVVVKKEVTAYRSLPYLGAGFDYAIYSQGAIN